jgi:hypothetical protein
MSCFVAVAVLMTIPHDALSHLGHTRDGRTLGALRRSPSFLRPRLLLSLDNTRHRVACARNRWLWQLNVIL